MEISLKKYKYLYDLMFEILSENDITMRIRSCFQVKTNNRYSL